ncbi:trypsin-like peptidase domain-containing protein [Candidatus Saccharibacteria bacterium]|nr:trypsin-like peptidase domain-containing protein [Candidatus Saccharibacteria bacterium]
MSNRSPHHTAKRLKKTLLIMIGGGVIALGLLTLNIATVTNKISGDSAKTEQTALTSVDTVLHNQEEFVLPRNTSNIPSQLDKTTLVKVIAKNQPAVVRILTVYCADITVASGASSLKKKDVCTAGVGSGSIISNDGYIATNGHVAVVSPKRALLDSLASGEEIQNYLDYLVAAELLTPTNASAIRIGIAKDSRSASDALDATIALISSTTITATNVDLQHAIQLGNEPVRIGSGGSRITLSFANTIVRARLIDQDFDQDAADQSLQTGQFTSSDVALLKMSGSFPYVRLGDGMSVKVNDQLTAIGFPAFIDDSVNTEQWQTVPSITQGKVTDIISDATHNGRKIINTSVPIAQGESGGPSFNDNGEQIGLNTYTALECEDLKCFGNGLVRDIADLKALLKKNNITLKMGGVTNDWYRGLDAYVGGNYAEALVAFRKVQDKYPANYLVSPLARLAREQTGSSTDISSSFQARTVTTTIFVIAGATLLVLISTIIGLIIHFTRKHHREEATANDQTPPLTPL